MLLSASVERFFVYRMRDFLNIIYTHHTLFDKVLLLTYFIYYWSSLYWQTILFHSKLVNEEKFVPHVLFILKLFHFFQKRCLSTCTLHLYSLRSADERNGVVMRAICAHIWTSQPCICCTWHSFVNAKFCRTAVWRNHLISMFCHSDQLHLNLTLTIFFKSNRNVLCC